MSSSTLQERLWFCVGEMARVCECHIPRRDFSSEKCKNETFDKLRRVLARNFHEAYGKAPNADEKTCSDVFIAYLIKQYQQEEQRRNQQLIKNTKRKAEREVVVIENESDESYRTEEETEESASEEIATILKKLKKQKCNYARCTNVYDPNETTREGETLQWMDCMECDGVFTCCSAHGRREMERFVLAHEGKCTNKK